MWRDWAELSCAESCPKRLRIWTWFDHRREPRDIHRGIDLTRARTSRYLPPRAPGCFVCDPPRARAHPSISIRKPARVQWWFVCVAVCPDGAGTIHDTADRRCDPPPMARTRRSAPARRSRTTPTRRTWRVRETCWETAGRCRILANGLAGWSVWMAVASASAVVVRYYVNANVFTECSQAESSVYD